MYQWKNNYKWIFSDLGAADKVGVNESGIGIFKRQPYKGLAKEILQNVLLFFSLDAIQILVFLLSRISYVNLNTICSLSPSVFVYFTVILGKNAKYKQYLTFITETQHKRIICVYKNIYVTILLTKTFNTIQNMLNKNKLEE